MSTILAVLLVAFPGKVDPSVVDRLAQEARLTPDEFRELAKSCEASRSPALTALSSMIQEAKTNGTKKTIVAELVQYRKDISARVRFAFPDLAKGLLTNSVGALPGATAKVLQVIDATTVRAELSLFAGTRPHPTEHTGSTMKDWQAMLMASEFPDAVYVHQDVIIRNFSTANLFDGSIESNVLIRSFQPFRCVGPFQYETGAGTTRTVPLLEPFDQNPLATYAQLLRGRTIAKAQRRKKSTEVVAAEPPRESAPTKPQPEPSKPQPVVTPSTPVNEPNRSRYLNATYGATIRFVADGKWRAANNKSGKDDSQYEEVSRTKDYVEVLQINGNIPTRLYADRIEQKLNGKWQSVASGHWLTP
jgi:hypothetical protein